MSEDQYADLVSFLGGKFGTIDRRFDAMGERFDAMDERFDALEERTTRTEVGLEALRDDVRAVAEGVTTNTARIDRLEASMNRRFDRLEEGWWARFSNHEERIRLLEG